VNDDDLSNYQVKLKLVKFASNFNVNRYYEVKLTSHKTTVKEETVQVNTEEDRRRKEAEKMTLKEDTVRMDTEYDQWRKGIVKTTTKEETVRVDSEDDRQRKDVEKLSTDVVTSDSDSFRTKTITEFIREESARDMSQRMRDESDSAFHKYQTDGDTRSSSMEESWSLTTRRSTQLETSTMLRSPERSGLVKSPSPSSMHGGMRCQAVDSEQLFVCSHEEKRRFYIRAVVDPRNGFHISIREVIVLGTFNNRLLL